ncbi:MAG: DUF2959 domain-containing protein [Phycisphaeraceae bacterium]|nr:DUF2959 family protein [Phycisphaerales bacterium]QOJ17426.1 MAG: DUF2959 domain-containing protein [Phycisphaeraceae bacterium]
MVRHLQWLPLGLVLLLVLGCQSTYYGAMEKFGYHKRDILVERVEEGRDDQQAAKQQFQSALDQFSALVGFKGGDLRALYDRLNGELSKCRDRAKAVTNRIQSIESVAAALFEEWETELNQYSNPDLKQRSERALRDTQQRYGQLIAAMKRAESRMPPILTAFNDQVLFLKHNLNAQAVASLEGDVAEMENDIAALIAEMNAAIAEADAFIEGMGQG